jgi:hypothetical protein
MTEVVNGFKRRTLREALTHMVSAFEAGQLNGGCRYVAPTGKPLFTDEQRRQIDQEFRCNGSWVSTLASPTLIGRENVEFMTGMTPAQADAVQIQFDGGEAAHASLIERMKLILEAGEGTIEGEPFVLEPV